MSHKYKLTRPAVVPVVRRLLGRLLQRRNQSASPAIVERAERTFYINYLREGMIVFDVGANVGELTLLFSRFVGESGQVHSFEASRATFQRLTTLCSAAGAKNIKLNYCAVADQEGTVKLQVYEEELSGWDTLAERPLQNYGIDTKPIRTEEVASITIDTYCEKQAIRKIDLLKIDVEGAEFQVLRGARRMLASRSIGCCAFEFGATTFDMGNNPNEMEVFLHKMGYRLRNVVKGDPVFPGRRNALSARYSMHVAVPA